jgi:hypothetical protein
VAGHAASPSPCSIRSSGFATGWPRWLPRQLLRRHLMAGAPQLAPTPRACIPLRRGPGRTRTAQGGPADAGDRATTLELTTPWLPTTTQGVVTAMGHATIVHVMAQPTTTLP